MTIFRIKGLEEEEFKFKEFFKELISLINRKNLNYCVIGYNALSRYTSAFRRSEDIDLLFFDSDYKEVKNLISKNKKLKDFKYKIINRHQIEIYLPKNKEGIKWVDFLLGSSEEVMYSLFDSIEDYIYEVKVNVASPESLCILFLITILYAGRDEDLKNKKIRDFNHLMKSGELNKKKFHKILEDSFPDLIEIYDSSKGLKIKSSEKKKGFNFSWGEYQDYIIKNKKKTI